MSLLLTITLLLPQFHTGLSNMSLLNGDVSQHVSALSVQSENIVIGNISAYSDLINLRVLAAIELQTHYKARAHFTMKFNNVAAYYY